MELWELDVCRAREVIVSGAATPLEMLESSFERIDAVDGFVEAWAYLDRDVAARNALEVQASGLLAGVPLGVKDIFNTGDMPTGMGSPVWSDFTPGNDARVVFNAKRAGAVVVGKTVTAEFAVHAPGKTRNPHNARYSPGTSSSGSAAAVATGMVPCSLGSQTAGSIIRPASYCGVYGFKSSYGVIPRTGMLKTTDTLDQVGYFCRSARDLLPLLEALRVRGKDYPLIAETLDRRSTPFPASPRIAVVTEQLDVWSEVSKEARDAFETFLPRLQSAGARLDQPRVAPILNEAHDVHATIYDRCISYYFEKESREGTLVSSQIMEMVERGKAISLQEYTSALDRQLAIQREFAALADGFDCCLTLSSAGPAPLVDELEPPDSALIWTLCAAPSLSIPLFQSGAGMPYGAQIVGSRYADHRVLRIAEFMENSGLAVPAKPVTPEGAAISA